MIITLQGSPRYIAVFNDTQKDTWTWSFINPRDLLRMLAPRHEKHVSGLYLQLIANWAWYLVDSDKTPQELTPAPNQDGYHPSGSRLLRPPVLFFPHVIWAAWVVLLHGGPMTVGHVWSQPSLREPNRDPHSTPSLSHAPVVWSLWTGYLSSAVPLIVPSQEWAGWRERERRCKFSQGRASPPTWIESLKNVLSCVASRNFLCDATKHPLMEHRFQFFLLHCPVPGRTERSWPTPGRWHRWCGCW